MEVEGTIIAKLVSILIDLGSTFNYVSHKVVENFKLKRKKPVKSWLVNLATRIEGKVTEFNENFPIQISDMSTTINLNVLVVVDSFNKSFICKDDDRNTKTG